MSTLLYPHRVCEKHGPFHQAEVCKAKEFNRCSECENEDVARFNFNLATGTLIDIRDDLRTWIATHNQHASLQPAIDAIETEILVRNTEYRQMPLGNARTGAQYFKEQEVAA